MEHLDFVLWMIGFPVSLELAAWLKSRSGEPRREYSEFVIGIESIAEFVLWFGIGGALW